MESTTCPTRLRASSREDADGPSEVIDPHSFEWRDEAWRGRPWQEAVIYELHVGTFTPQGTFSGVVIASCRISGTWASPRSS